MFRDFRAAGGNRGGGAAGAGWASEGVDWSLGSSAVEPPWTPAAGSGVSFIHSLVEWIDSLSLHGGYAESELVLSAGDSDPTIWLTLCGVPSFLPVQSYRLSSPVKPSVVYFLHREVTPGRSYCRHLS